MEALQGNNIKEWDNSRKASLRFIAEKIEEKSNLKFPLLPQPNQADPKYFLEANKDISEKEDCEYIKAGVLLLYRVCDMPHQVKAQQAN